MSQVIKEVNVMSCAKISGLVYALLGLIGGLMFSLVAVLGSAVGAAEDELGGLLGMVIGVGGGYLLAGFLRLHGLSPRGTDGSGL